MGRYLNPGSRAFRMAVDSEVFVDKTPMIAFLNSCVNTNSRYVCVSRPRRFGKTMAADMLCAYYGRDTNARSLFDGLKLTQEAPTKKRTGEMLCWDAYMSCFEVIRLTITEFLKEGQSIVYGLKRLQRLVTREIARAHPNIAYLDEGDLALCMSDVYEATGVPFVVIIDEWDAPMRERQDDEAGQRAYLDFLRDWLKDQTFIALAYMTGILPVKKYGVHSALNMFREYSMAAPLWLAPFTGFTEEEVRGLCETHNVSFEQVRSWYDGYEVSGVAPVKDRPTDGRPSEPPRWSLYAPLSVATAVVTGEIANYWGGTETYEALAVHIRRDFDGLKEKVTLLMDGARIKVALGTYQNDMTSFRRADDVLAMLVHLGYLGWDDREGVAFVPNREVLDIFRDSTMDSAWEPTFRAYEASKELIRATLAADEKRVAEIIEEAHDRADNKTYNSEAALSYSVRLPYYAAQMWYTEVVELDSGQGYADVAFLPSPRHPDKPCLVVELKWNAGADTALAQIRDRRYHGRLEHYLGNLLLVGISYCRDIRPGAKGYKHHTCRIERA